MIAIGYRVNSKRATQFRIWATNVLKKYLVKGYAVNQKKLLEERDKFRELQGAIVFLQEKAQKKTAEKPGKRDFKSSCRLFQNIN